MKFDSIKQTYSISITIPRENYKLYIKTDPTKEDTTEMDVTFLTKESLLLELASIRKGLIKNKTPKEEHDQFISTYIKEHYGYLPKESLQLILDQLKEI